MPRLWTKISNNHRELKINDLTKGTKLAQPDFRLSGAHDIHVVDERSPLGSKCLMSVVNRNNGNAEERRRDEYRVAGQLPLGKHYWFEFYFKAWDDWVPDTKIGEIIFQLHATPDPGEKSANPPFALTVRGSKLEVTQRWTDVKVFTDKNYKRQIIRNVGDLKGGKWYHVLFHQFSRISENDGRTRLWIDGKQVWDWEGGNTFNDSKASYIKFGIYKPIWKNSDSAKRSPTDKRIYYHADIRDIVSPLGFGLQETTTPEELSVGGVELVSKGKSTIEVNTNYGGESTERGFIYWPYDKNPDLKMGDPGVQKATITNNGNKKKISGLNEGQFIAVRGYNSDGNETVYSEKTVIICVTPATLSYDIDDLEDWVNMDIFDSALSIQKDDKSFVIRAEVGSCSQQFEFNPG